jgi:peptide deformylase
MIEDTMRYNEIHIVDNLVYPNNFVVSGLMAVAIQHELDHLNGVLLSDIAIKQTFKKVKLKPNDLCDCGKIDVLTKKPFKYKKCCGKNG